MNEIKIIIFFFCLCFLIIFILFYYTTFKVKLNEDKIIFIEKGLGTKEIGNLLLNEKIIKNRVIFNIIATILGKNRSIKSGEYIFKDEISIFSVIDDITKGNYYFRKIVIPECLTANQIVELINNNLYLKGYLNYVPNEGSMFPDTYFFLRNENKNDIILRMQKKMKKVANEIWKENKTLLKSKIDMVKLASIINAESKKNEEKFIVSSVFHNRLSLDMRLQSDPTVLYGKNINKKKISRKITKLDLRNDNPWNTYRRKGLPKTPICNPGLVSMKAAIKPLKTNFLYFVTDGNGGHRFSSNLKEHNKNIKVWKKN